MNSIPLSRELGTLALADLLGGGSVKFREEKGSAPEKQLCFISSFSFATENLAKAWKVHP